MIFLLWRTKIFQNSKYNNAPEAIEHFCIFNFRELSRIEKQKIYESVHDYISKIPWVKKWSFGENIITLRNNQGYEFGLRIEFGNIEELDSYNVHPSHRNFVTYIKQFYKKKHICVDWNISKK